MFKTKFADGQTLDVGGVSIRLKISPRARRVSLRVDLLSRQAIAVAPSARRLPEAVAFARSRQAWLTERLADIPPPRDALTEGDRLVVLGLSWRLLPDGRRPRLMKVPGEAEARLHGCGEAAVDRQLVVRAIRHEALAVFTGFASSHCAALGVAVPPISTMDAKTRWGSCTPGAEGRPARVRLSWRLALAPPPVADYVVAHECAHLLEANHGPRFWALVETLVGNPKALRGWLKTRGGSLHALL